MQHTHVRQAAHKPIISLAEKAAIEARIRILYSEDAVATEELADATHNGAETYHDNAAFDAAKDKKNLAQAGLGKLLTLLRQAEVVESNVPTKAAIGTKVRYRDEDSGQEYEIKLAGDGAWLMDGEWASAYAPIGKLLLGAKPGESRSGQIGDRTVSLTVLDIDSL
ncbi:GreA/GreB family elongation factor [bacterium]|nr:GreA/GreB family elongation factor [bacterium]